jgi:hypothetical protein
MNIRSFKKELNTKRGIISNQDRLDKAEKFSDNNFRNDLKLLKDNSNFKTFDECIDNALNELLNSGDLLHSPNTCGKSLGALYNNVSYGNLSAITKLNVLAILEKKGFQCSIYDNDLMVSWEWL